MTVEGHLYYHNQTDSVFQINNIGAVYFIYLHEFGKLPALYSASPAMDVNMDFRMYEHG
jgi:hypothetical protein